MMASHQCLMRSVMIPSSAKRSGWISAACSIPVVVVTHFFYARHQVLGSPLGPWGYTCIAALLVLPAVLVSTYISHIIYGLTQQVREATQLGQYTLEEKIGEGGMGIVFQRSPRDAAGDRPRSSCCRPTRPASQRWSASSARCS